MDSSPNLDSSANYSPRSSLTAVDHIPYEFSKVHRISTLQKEILEDELRIEEYGADDIHEPPFKPVSAQSTFSTSASPSSRTESTVDPNIVDWDGPNDPSNPQNWSRKHKWLLTLLCAVMTLTTTFASSAPTTASSAIHREFHVSYELTYLITSVFLLGFTAGPLFWAPGSELLGRKPVFRFTMVMFTLFQLGQALAPNMRTLLITRFFDGFFAAAPLTNSGGMIADMWDAVGRGRATSLFAASVFLGPVLGPVVGGYIVESHLGWRWIFWVMMIVSGFFTIMVVVFLPETYAPVLLQKKARQLRKAEPEKAKDLFAEHERQDWSLKGLFHRTLYRPFYMLALEPVLVLVTIYLSLVYGLLYALFEAFPIVFMIKHGLSISQTGLIFVGVGIGSTSGAILNIHFTRHYAQLIQRWRGFPPPEQRLFGAMVGAPLLVVGVFWLGWTGGYPGVHWIVPALSGVALGMSVSLIFISFLSYLIDTYLMYSASALAANTIVRSAIGAAFPLFIVQMFNKLGVNWACTLLGLIALLLSPSPFLFYKYGPRVRMASRFAPCIDLKIAKELEEEERPHQQA